MTEAIPAAPRRPDEARAASAAGPQNPFRSAKVHAHIVRALAGLILGGTIAPGESLPNEEDLAIRFGASRSSVREAVKTLSAKGLIETRQRVGAWVRARSEWRLLDPMVLGWHPDIRQDTALVDSIVEARRIIEPAAAELAAVRATAADVVLIEEAWTRMRKAMADDLAACSEADLALHRGVIEASHNLVLQGFIGTLQAALRASFLATNQRTECHDQSIEAHGSIVACIRDRDPAGARAAMGRVLDLADQELHRASR